MKYTFKELIDAPKLQELTDELYTATSIPSAIVAMDGEILTGSGWQKICTDFHRKHPQIEKECIESDTNIRTKLADGEPFAIYKCPRGLVDASSPIIIAGEHVANVFSGQVFLEPPDETTEQFFREQARKFGFDETEYIKAFKEVPIFTEKKFRAGISFLAKLAQTTADSGLTRLRELEAMEALRKNEGKYRGLVEGMDDSIYRMSLPDGMYEYMSPAARKVFGYSAEEFIENPLIIRKLIHPDFAEYFEEKWADLIEGKVSPTYEYKILDPEGNERWIVQSNTGIFDDSGNIIAIEGLSRDITDMKLAGEKVLENEKLLKKSQEMAHIGSWRFDIRKNELYWSDEVYRIFGLTPGQFGATREAFLEAIHPDDREMVNQAYNTAAESHQPYEITHRVLRPDGTVRIVHEKSEEILDETGETILSMGMVHDITEQVQAEEQIKSSLKEKEVLLSEIHHRVKNNMQVISSLLKLQSAKIEDKKYVDLFKDSENRIRSMSLIHEKLYQSKDFANVDFNGYVKSIANHLIRSYAVAPDKIRLNTKIEDVSLGLDNAIPCGLIINELISNSLKYAFPKDRKGEINIVLREINSHEIQLTVSDDGIGIPAEIDIRETESLGLQLVHILAENQLEGSIELDREAGTAFRIRFKN